jgi:hypothetical protein
MNGEVHVRNLWEARGEIPSAYSEIRPFALTEPHSSFTLTSRDSHDDQVLALAPNAVDVRSLAGRADES